MSTSVNDRLNVSEYLARDWTGLAALKDADWQVRQKSRSAGDSLTAAARLRAWAQLARPDLDRSALQALDLENHVRVSLLLRRADARLSR